MPRVTIRAVKTHLSRLIAAALAGKDVVMACGNTLVVRLVPITKRAFQVDLLAGRLGTGPDFLAPPDEAELDPWRVGGDFGPARHLCLGLERCGGDGQQRRLH